MIYTYQKFYFNQKNLFYYILDLVADKENHFLIIRAVFVMIRKKQKNTDNIQTYKVWYMVTNR